MSFPFIIVVPALRVNGMAIYPFILIREPKFKQDAILIRHETIHLKQELELLIVPFYILYLLNYGINLLKYRNHDEAYLKIVFEQEAYTHDADSAYLYKRRFWAWLKFIG